MQFNILEAQRASVLRMIDLQVKDDVKRQNLGQTWKVLIYDRHCQDIIAPLLKIGSLRTHGVTLNFQITQNREPVPEVTAVYFVAPTSENVDILNRDAANQLYEQMHINFVSPISSELLEKLAFGFAEANAVSRVQKVVDRYTCFVALAPHCFSLNMPRIYQMLRLPQEDSFIEGVLDNITLGLLSVLVTLRVVPIIRCPSGSAAEMIARKLEDRLRGLLASSASSDLFSTSSIGATRPLLVLLDREVDLCTMVQHTWTYQAMCHDVLGMRLNKVTVPATDDGRKLQYDLDTGDAFWAGHMGSSFPEMSDAVHGLIESWKKQRADMTEDQGLEGMNDSFTAAFNAIPQMTEMKRSIDMHTNIAHVLLAEIKKREIDKFYGIEDAFASQSLSTAHQECLSLLNNEKGTVADKERALLVFYISQPQATPQQLQSLISALEQQGGDASATKYLQEDTAMRGMLLQQPTPQEKALPSAVAMLGGFAGKVRAQGEGLMQMASNMQRMMVSQKELKIQQVVEGLVEQKPGDHDGYLYIDPKAQQHAQTRVRSQYKQSLVFVVGGGSYVESQALHAWAASKGKNIIYGSTDFASPTEFADELSHLHRALYPENA